MQKCEILQISPNAEGPAGVDRRPGRARHGGRAALPAAPPAEEGPADENEEAEEVEEVEEGGAGETEEAFVSDGAGGEEALAALERREASERADQRRLAAWPSGKQ